jgi:hypothetical protein
LHGKNESEARAVKLILDRRNDETDQQMLTQAQDRLLKEKTAHKTRRRPCARATPRATPPAPPPPPTEEIYTKYYQPPSVFRAGKREERFDKGLKRPASGGNSEAAWIKRRRHAVGETADDKGRQSLTDALAAADLEQEELTEKQRDLVRKQEQLADKKKVQAYLDEALLPTEVDADLAGKAEQELKARRKRERDRAAKQRRVKAVKGKRRMDFQGADCFLVAPLQNEAEVRRNLQAKSCNVVDKKEDASVIVCEQPAHLSMRRRFVAVLTGAFVATPRVFVDGGGPVIKYRPARTPTRQVFVTDEFMAKHPSMVEAILDLTDWIVYPAVADRPRPSPAGSAASALHFRVHARMLS